jgi:RNA polymerase sigma-70 factor (ECF subfamily)
VEATLRLDLESPSQAAEDALVEAAVAGDASAFAALYDRHLVRVYRHVYYRVGNQSDAEDLTQQVFLQAWRAIRRFRPTGAPFVAWLFTIAHNLAVQFHRRARDAAPLELEPAAGARWSDPQSEVLATYERTAVRRAILRLKPDFQQVVILRFVEGLPAREVGAAIGKSEANVRVMQHRALVELKRLLDREVNP